MWSATSNRRASEMHARRALSLTTCDDHDRHIVHDSSAISELC